MKECPLDGGEALLEAFRRLGMEYVISSPGSEWPPVWEALARQKVERKKGPKYIGCWHETTAVAMGIGYTNATEKMVAVLLHTGDYSKDLCLFDRRIWHKYHFSYV